MVNLYFPLQQRESERLPQTEKQAGLLRRTSNVSELVHCTITHVLLVGDALA